MTYASTHHEMAHDKHSVVPEHHRDVGSSGSGEGSQKHLNVEKIEMTGESNENNRLSSPYDKVRDLDIEDV